MIGHSVTTSGNDGRYMFAKTLPLCSKLDSRIKYVIIAVEQDNKWLFARHKKRSTWELPGGHREQGEEVLAAAERELFEETGIKTTDLEPVCEYYAEEAPDDFAYGRLFYLNTKAHTKPPVSFEMAETEYFNFLPENLTHPEIHTLLFDEALLFQRKKLVKKAVEDVLKADDIDSDVDLHEYGLSTQNLILILIELEDRYGIKLDNCYFSVEKLDTLDKFYDTLERQYVQGGPGK